MRIQKFTKEFDLLIPKQRLNYSEFKVFLTRFGLANKVDNPLSPDYKLAHELWKSMFFGKKVVNRKPDEVELVTRDQLIVVVQVIVGLGENAKIEKSCEASCTSR